MENISPPIAPEPNPLDPSDRCDVGRGRPRKQRTSDIAFVPPENLIFNAGASWAAKVSEKNPRDDVLLRLAPAEELENITIIPSGNVTPPGIKIDEKILHIINEEWKDAIIIKLMGRPWDVVILRSRLANLWNIRGNLELVDVGHNLFVVRKLDPVIRESILTKGPWKIAGQFLALQKWFP